MDPAHVQLLRDTMRSTVLDVIRCLSVCLSHSRIVSKRLKISSVQTPLKIKRVTPERAGNKDGWDKFAIFGQHLVVFWKWRKTGPYVNKMSVLYQTVPFPKFCTPLDIWGTCSKLGLHKFTSAGGGLKITYTVREIMRNWKPQCI